MDSSGTVPSSVRWMRVLAAIVLAGVACYAGFMLIEQVGTSTATARATVIGKRHVAAHRTYVTEIINGRSVAVPRDVGDAYVVDLLVANDRTTAAVPQDLYDRLAAGDSVSVQVRRRRLSRAIDVLDVTR